MEVTHLQALRSFIRSLVEQAEKSGGCECHRPPSLLLLGPPGAGKTYLVKQMSTVCDMPLYGAHAHQLSGALALRELFDSAREIDYPSLLFVDDIDMLYTDQEEEDPPDSPDTPLLQGLRTELFAQLGPRKLKIYDCDSKKNPVQHTLRLPAGGCGGPGGGGGRGRVGLGGGQTKFNPLKGSCKQRPCTPQESVSESPFPDNSGLIVVAATSAPWLLFKDHELLSRFRGVYLVGLPDKETRYEILKTLLQKVHHNLTDKDIWVVADKTEGFTPSDLMILTKSLNYKQFEFLFTLTRAHVANIMSSEDGSVISSEMTESDTESDEELHDEVIELNKKLLMGLHERRSVMTPMPGHSSPIRAAPDSSTTKDRKSTLGGSESSNLVKSLNLNNKFVANLALLAADWNSDAETSKANISQRSPTPVAESKNSEVGPHEDHFDPCDPRSTPLEGDTSSPDSALGRSKSSEEDIELTTKKMSASMQGSVTPTSGVEGGGVPTSWRGSPSPPHESPSSLNSFVCDNSLSAINPSNVSQVDNKMVDRSVEEVEVVVETREMLVLPPKAGDPEASSGDPAKAEDARASTDKTGEDVREFKLTIHEPPDPVRNDNQAIDSDRDSDSDLSSMRASPRNRRVNFSAMPPMEPLTVDIDSLDDPTMCPYSTRCPTPPAADLSADEVDRGAGATSSSNNNILRSLLSRSASVSYRGDSPHSDFLRSKREESGRDYGLGSHGTADLGLGDDASERRRSCPDLDRSLFNGSDDDASGLKALLGVGICGKNKTSTPEPPRTPTSITPTPSETSCRSVASSGSGARVTGASSESDTTKKQDSDSSFGKSDSHTNGSSDMSTITCNEAGETLECHSDVEEKFRNLREDLGEQQQPNSSSSSSPSEDESFVTKKPFHPHLHPQYANLNFDLDLDDLGEINLQILTLADILDVVAKSPRSISDEEIKRYTDFMMWFSKVARSACPHSKNKDGSSPNESQLDDVSLASTMSCATGSKKRRRPLKKVGRFLLKALMFILD